MGLKIQSEKPLLVTRGKISRYGLITKSHKHVWCTGKIFTTCLSLTRALVHQQQQATKARRWSNHQEQFGIWHLAEGLFDMLTGEAGDPTANPAVREQLNLPAEKQLPH